VSEGWQPLPVHPERGATLARYARACIRAKLGDDSISPPDAPWAADRAATFVTLRFHTGALQGCIGTIHPHRTIVEDIAYNAVAAATRDHRGTKLSLADVDQLDVEVSILSPLDPIPTGTEAEMWAHVRPGTDGVVLEHEDCRGVLLPAVWPKLGSLAAFAAALKAKAGYPPSFWHADLQLWRYTVDHHVDPAPRR
jgi:AmmeMemoRadiSam system protein A